MDALFGPAPAPAIELQSPSVVASSVDLPHNPLAPRQVAPRRSVVQEGFAARKARFLQKRHSAAAATAKLGALNAREQLLEAEVWKKSVAAAGIDSSKSFLDCKADYDASDLLAVLNRMPKGGTLHTHGAASGDFHTLVAMVQKEKRFYAWQGDDSKLQGLFKMIPTGQEVEAGWVPASTVAAEKLYEGLTLPENLPDSETCWKFFWAIWDRIGAVTCVAPFYFGKGGFFWEILKTWRNANVMYIEMKEVLFVPWINWEGETLTELQWLEMFVNTVKDFQAEYPDFVGCRLITVCLKFASVEDMREYYRKTVAMKKAYPDFVAGFDMAGHEDGQAPIADFADMLLEEQEAAQKEGLDVPLILHAGETNSPAGSQVVGAVAIGSERIGHGFAMARHPVLIEETISRGLSLECCPISNQVLGYCPDLANHAALGLFRHGVAMTISPDDPGVWHYSDPSYDFCAVAKAWNLELIEVKALAKNSLLFSTLRGEQQAKALASWEKQWDAWVESELRRASK